MKFESPGITPPILTAREAVTLNKVIFSADVQLAVKELRQLLNNESFGGHHSQDVPIRKNLEQNILDALAGENVQIESDQIQSFVENYPNSQ